MKSNTYNAFFVLFEKSVKGRATKQEEMTRRNCFDTTLIDEEDYYCSHIDCWGRHLYKKLT